MKGTNSLILGLLTGFLFSACEKEELPVPPYDRGDVMAIQIAMGPTYENQVWYDLGENKVVATGDRFDWDLAFDCSDSSDFIFLNGAVAMMAAPTGIPDITKVTSFKDLAFKPDHHSGNTDSLAFGKWWETDEVWVIDRGYDAAGNPRGKYKIQFTGEEGGVYTFAYAKLNSSEISTASVTKNNLYNRIAFSFETNNTVNTEPPKTEYDLCFTQYTYTFYNPYIPYLVSGVLLNPHQTSAVHDSTRLFEAIGSEHLAEYDLSGRADVIGYDWKIYDLDAGVYTVFPEMCYVVKDQEGFYYKIHFTDYYSTSGEKGYPTMEVKRL